MKREFNWRDYDNYSKWLDNVLKTLTENIEEKDKEIDRLNNMINELEKTIENRLMAVPDDVLDDGIEEIKRITKIAIYQVVLGDLNKLKALKENNK